MKVFRIKEELGANKPVKSLDKCLIFVMIALLSLGFIMVASSSIEVAACNLGRPFYYAKSQALYILVGLLVGSITACVKVKYYYRYARIILIFAFVFLLLVLIPGIGKTVNGSTRWLPMGFVAFQVSEFAKLSFVIYLSRYLVKIDSKETTSVKAYINPLFLLALLSVLLLLEPDFGATVVIIATSLGMLFLANAPLKSYFMLIICTALGLLFLAISAPYRMKRITSFMDPWENQYDSGYQLTQSLIAFGRGEYTGVGLGASIQKLFFLPESHTDFLFAVLAEELGLIGSLSVILLFAVFIFRGFKLGFLAKQKNQLFASYLAYGITLWIGLQAIVSIGVNTGILPTKGLTLPFISYGGSSIVLVIIACSMLLRINFELNEDT